MLHSDSQPSRSEGFWLAALIALAGVAAYANSLSGPFLFDDQTSVPDNQSIRHLSTALWPDHGSGQTVEGRPTLNLSFAVNYALGGAAVRGYHEANLLIHILTGLALFGLVRRTLLMPALAREFGGHASLLAGSIALLWTVHPLQTESVTYIVQRAESFTGLWFFFCFYTFARSMDGSRTALWRGLCVGSFLLGAGTKEVMAAALPLLLLYDSVFVSGSLSRAWRTHRGMYIALSACLVPLAMLISAGGWNRSGTIGPGIGMSFLSHALTQPTAMLTYMKLSLWPVHQVFDYGRFSDPSLKDALPELVAILVLVAATLIAFKTSPALGFLGAWFFVILSPTSLAPEATQIVVEHRMYLPLAGCIALVVFGLYRLLGKASFPVFLVLAIALGWLTARRNGLYSTAELIWRDTAEKRPNNERAHYSLGNALALGGHTTEAIAEYATALRLDPDYAEAHNALGNALNSVGRTAEAIGQYEEAIRLEPGFADAHNDLGSILSAEGRSAEAISQFEAALSLEPHNADAHNNLGAVLADTGRSAEAVVQYEEALRLRPDYAEAHNNLGTVLIAEGRGEEAIVQYKEALRLKPNYAEAHNNLGDALKAAGRMDAAAAQYEEALRLRPDYADAHNNLGTILSAQGRTDDAIAEYKEALRLKPGLSEAHSNLGGALRTEGRLNEAIVQYETALRLKADYAEAHNNLANALVAEGRADEAIFHYQEALRLRPNVASIHLNLALALLKIPGRTDEAADQLKAVLRLQSDNGLARQILAGMGAPGT